VISTVEYPEMTGCGKSYHPCYEHCWNSGNLYQL